MSFIVVYIKEEAQALEVPSDQTPMEMKQKALADLFPGSSDPFAAAARLVAAHRLQARQKSVTLLLIPWRGAYLRSLSKRFKTWKECYRRIDSFDIVKIPSAVGDLYPRGLSLETSEIGLQHFVPERGFEDEPRLSDSEAFAYEEDKRDSGPNSEPNSENKDLEVQRLQLDEDFEVNAAEIEVKEGLIEVKDPQQCEADAKSQHSEASEAQSVGSRHSDTHSVRSAAKSSQVASIKSDARSVRSDVDLDNVQEGGESHRSDASKPQSHASRPPSQASRPPSQASRSQASRPPSQASRSQASRPPSQASRPQSQASRRQSQAAQESKAQSQASAVHSVSAPHSPKSHHDEEVVLSVQPKPQAKGFHAQAQSYHSAEVEEEAQPYSTPDVEESHNLSEADISPIVALPIPAESREEILDEVHFSTRIPASHTSIHQRLYAEATRRRLLQAQYEQEKRTVDLKECTFTPEGGLARGSANTGVHLRLYQSVEEEKLKEQLNLRRRMEQEMTECTFSPRVTGAQPSFRSKALSFTRLYEEAERKHARLEEAKRVADTVAKESLAKPSVRTTTTKVYEKLFSVSKTQASKLRKQQMEKNQSEIEGITFKPKLTARKAKDAAPNVPVYQRLYQCGEVIQRKLETKRKEQTLALTHVRKPSPERIEQLYQNGLQKASRQAQLRAKLDRELGINFTPRTNFTTPPCTARDRPSR